MITATNNPLPSSPDASPTKLDKGGYEGTAETLDNKIDEVLAEALLKIEGVLSDSTIINNVTTSSAVPATGNIHAIGIGPGTYPNWGGMVVPANNIGTLQRVDGVYSVSLTAIDLSSKVNVSDVVNNLTSTSTIQPLSANQGKILNEKNIKIETWTAKVYASGDQVNHLGKDWVSNAATVAGDVPGTSSKWNIRLTAYENKSNLQVGKNLFNWQDPDVLIDRAFSTNGTGLQTTSAAFITGFIPVLAGQEIICNRTSAGYGNSFYDVNKNFISVNTATGVLTVPVGAFYLRKTVVYSQSSVALTIQQIQIELGTVSTFFEAYNLSVPITELNRAALKSEFKIEQFYKNLKADKTFSKNLFNKSSTSIISGYYLNSIGDQVANASYSISHYIPVIPGSTYIASNTGLGGAKNCYYDINKNFIGNYGDVAFLVPSDVYYVRLSFTNVNLNSLQLENNTVATSYAAYTENKELDDTKLLISNKLDPFFGNNLFNKDSSNILNSKYLNTTGILQDNALYFVSDYMAVLPNTAYISSNFSMGGAKSCVYDANKNFVSSFGTEGITTPSNGYFIRMSGTVANKAIQQFEKGTVATSYVPYTIYGFQEPLLEKLPTRTPSVILPKKLYFLKNKQNCIYYTNVILNNLKGTATAYFNKGTNRNKLNTFNFSAAATNQTLNSLLIDNFKKIESKNITYDVIDGVAVNTGKTVNVLHIGDSFTDIGSWVKELKVLMNAQGVTYNLLGTCGNSTFRAEGLSGGRLENTFLNASSGVARIVNITGVTTLPSTGYPGQNYTDANGNIWQPRGGKIDGSGNGKLVVTRSGAVTADFNTFPSSGVLTKTSTGEGDATISYSTPVSAYYNPFINPSTGLLDLTNYITFWGFATPNVVIFQFTWNDLGLWATDVTIAALVANFKLAADHVHTAYPSAKVVFSIEPYGSVNGNLDWHGKKYSVLRFTELMLIQFEDDVNYNTWVRIAPSYAFVDLENGYSSSTVVPCERYPLITEVSVGDGVHPSTGMLQIADCVAPIVSAII